MGAKTWIFDPSRLVAGDIVLERGDSLKSKAIAWKDGGTYSHALLWLGNSDFIEAVGTGVRVISFARVVITKPNRWRLLRLDDPAVAAVAAANARNMAHKGYDLWGALKTQGSGRKAPNTTSLFCSQLVATAYEKAGVSLIDGMTAQQVTPAALENRAKLRTIELPLLEIDRNLGVPLDRDAGYKLSPMHKEMIVSQAAFKAVQTEIKTLTDPEIPELPFPPGHLYELLEVLARQRLSDNRMEDKLLAELSQRDYFDLATGMIVAATLDAKSKVANISSGALSAGEREEIRAQILAISRSYKPTIDRYRSNGQNFLRIYAARKHPLWLKLATMYHRNASGLEAIQAIAAEADEA